MMYYQRMCAEDNKNRDKISEGDFTAQQLYCKQQQVYKRYRPVLARYWSGLCFFGEHER